MVQLAECWLCKGVNLSSIPRTCVKDQMSWCVLEMPEMLRQVEASGAHRPSTEGYLMSSKPVRDYLRGKGR